MFFKTFIKNIKHVFFIYGPMHSTAETGLPRLTSREIIFEVFQPM